MKKFILYILALALFIGCKSNSDILATYKGGEITRGDLREKLEASGIPVESFERKKLFQEKELKMIAVDRIAVLEAKKINYQKSERFTFLFDDVRSRYLGAFLLENIIEEKGFNEKSVKVRHIVMKIKGQTPQERNTVLARAREIITKLDEGTPMNKLAVTYSDDITRAKGGEVGYIIRGIFPEEYTEAAYSLKKGEYTKKPVYLPKRGRVFIIQADDVIQLTPDNFDKIITNKKMIDSYKKLIYTRARNQYVEDLKNTNDVRYNEDRLDSTDRNAVLFSIGDRKYTIGEINDRADMINKISYLKNKPITAEFKKRIAESYFRSELLKREALKRGIDRDSRFRKKIKLMEESYLAGDYMEHMSMQDVMVSEKEIQEEYNRGKNERYARSIARGEKKIHIPRPYHEVKDMAMRAVWNMKALKKRAIWIEDKLKEYQFSIDKSELAGN